MKRSLFLLLFLITLSQNSRAQCWSFVSNGAGHTLAIKTDGTLWAWGSNSFGQLGDGTTSQKNSPVQINLLNDWQKLSSGFDYCFSIKTDGSLWGWGYNNSGQIGDGTITNKIFPVNIR